MLNKIIVMGRLTRDPELRRIMFAQASGLLSRAGQLKHCNSHTIRVKYIDPIGVKHLKEVVRNESKRRQRAQQRILAGGAA